MTDATTLAALHRLVPAAEEEDLLEELREEARQRELHTRQAEFARLDGARFPPPRPAGGTGDERRSPREAVHDALHLLAAELDARLLPDEG